MNKKQIIALIVLVLLVIICLRYFGVDFSILLPDKQDNVIKEKQETLPEVTLTSKKVFDPYGMLAFYFPDGYLVNDVGFDFGVTKTVKTVNVLGKQGFVNYSGGEGTLIMEVSLSIIDFSQKQNKSFSANNLLVLLDGKKLMPITDSDFINGVDYALPESFIISQRNGAYYYVIPEDAIGKNVVIYLSMKDENDKKQTAKKSIVLSEDMVRAY